MLARDGHSRGPAFEGPGGYVIGVLPVARPGNGDLVLCWGDAVEELCCVGILCEVDEAGDCVVRREVRPIESSRKVLRCAASQWGAGVYADPKEPLRGCGVDHGKLD